MTRPRFSLRWLLIVFTLLTIAFYVAFVGPVANARKFADAVNQGNAELAAALAGPAGSLSSRIATSEEWPISATVAPRDWDDVWHFRCRVRFVETNESFHPSSDVIFGPFGRRAWLLYV